MDARQPSWLAIALAAFAFVQACFGIAVGAGWRPWQATPANFEPAATSPPQIPLAAITATPDRRSDQDVKALWQRLADTEASLASIDGWIDVVDLPGGVTVGQCAARVGAHLEAGGFRIDQPTPEMIHFRSSAGSGRIWCWPAKVYVATVSVNDHARFNQTVAAAVAVALNGN